jgi:hypothetical protein
MPDSRRTRPSNPFLLLLVVLVILGVLATGGLAIAASGRVHVTVTKKAITITGSRGVAGEAVQINYDPKRCVSYAGEQKRETEYSDIRGTKKGAFRYAIRRSALHLSKPTPHYACVYLIVLKGKSFKQLASASAKLS